MEITKLPPELVQKIFRYLSLNELTACKLVCKRFLANVNGFNLGKLFLCRAEEYKNAGCPITSDFKQFFNFREMNFDRLIFQPSGRHSRLAEFSRRTFLCSITELYLGDNVVIDSNNYDFLNNFQMLEVLRFGALLDEYLDQIKFRKKLSFAGLRELSIQFSAESKSTKITIEAPRLRRLSVTTGLVNLQLPQSQRSLIYLSADQYKNWMNALENLEILRCHEVYTSFEANAVRWTKLRRFEVGDEESMTKLKELKRRRNELKFDVYYDDFYIEDLDTSSLSLFSLPHRSQEKRRLENWFNRSPQISDHLALDSIKFSDLDECLTRIHKEPNNFIWRLCNLSQLDMRALVKNRVHLLNLLNVNRSLRCLSISIGAKYDQELLERLPIACPYVFQLNTKVSDKFPSKPHGNFYPGDWVHTWKRTEIDYGFLLKFKFLANVHLDEIDSLEQIASLFKKNSFIVHLRLADNEIHVFRNADREHKLIYHKMLAFSSKNVDELVHYLRFRNTSLPPVYIYGDDY